MSQQKVHSFLIPLNLFQSEAIPLKSRVLMAMSKFMNHDRVSWVQAAKICIILGEVDSEGVPTTQGLKAVRAARQALTKSGVLEHFKVMVDGESQHRWRINLHPLKPGLTRMIESGGSGYVAVDRWADSEASKEPKPEKTSPKEAPKLSKPKVEEVQEEEFMDESQEEGPSAEDIALRQAVLARSKKEQEEESMKEEEVPAPEEESLFSWSMVGL